MFPIGYHRFLSGLLRKQGGKELWELIPERKKENQVKERKRDKLPSLLIIVPPTVVEVSKTDI